MNILRVKDYLNSEYLDKWLEIAEGIIEENVKNFEDLSAEKESYREQIVKLNEDLNNESDEGIKKDLEKEIFNLSQEADGKEIEISKYLKENKNKSDSEFIIGELKKNQRPVISHRTEKFGGKWEWWRREEKKKWINWWVRRNLKPKSPINNYSERKVIKCYWAVI